MDKPQSRRVPNRRALDVESGTIQIGRLQVMLERREIRANGELLPISSRAFGVLEILIRARGAVVSKDEIMQRVWPDSIVEENNLTVHIATLRKLLGDDRRLIQTVPCRGYLLVQQSPISSGLDTPKAHPEPGGIGDGSVLIGRQVAVAEVIGQLRHSRNVTLVGTGGIGKTRLAAEVAAQVTSHFPDGLVFVSLATVSDESMVPDALAAALGVQVCDGRATVRHSVQSIVAATTGKCILVVLDNCEHLIGAVAALAEALTGGNPTASVLATSREALRTKEEILYRVPPLETAPEGCPGHQVMLNSAVQLFLQRARAVDAGFPSDERALDLIGLVCRRLDGIPLAIELAAARAATLGIEILAEHLDDRFRILAGGPRTALPQHQTLKATFDWSYRLLDEVERPLFRRLGVFVNGFSFDAAFSVMAGQGATRAEVFDALSGLVSKSLVVHDCLKNPRYRLLETLRAYALQQLEANGERKVTTVASVLYVRGLFSRTQDIVGARPLRCWLKT